MMCQQVACSFGGGFSGIDRFKVMGGLMVVMVLLAVELAGMYVCVFACAVTPVRCR